MKLRTTEKETFSLTEKQQRKLASWQRRNYIIIDGEQIKPMTIGMMIQYLSDLYENRNMIKMDRDKHGKWVVTHSGDPLIGEEDSELCSALWRVVKKSLDYTVLSNDD